jgi:hypothetical protein
MQVWDEFMPQRQRKHHEPPTGSREMPRFYAAVRL